MSDRQYVARVQNGRVSTYDARTGSYVSGMVSPSDPGAEAYVTGDLVQVRSSKYGSVTVYDARTGAYVRKIF